MINLEGIMKRLALLLLAVLTFAFLFSCGGDSGITPPIDEETEESGGKKPGKTDKEDDEKKEEASVKEFNVAIAITDGVTVNDENPKKVKEGDDVSFNVVINEGYVLKSVSHGIYDGTAQKLTILNIKRNTNVTFEVEEASYDTTVTFKYVFLGEDGDTSTPKGNNATITMGTVITVRAKNEDMAFLGWSFSKNGTIVSTEKEFSFKTTPDIVEGSTFYVYANYRDTNVYYYDLNGGSVDLYSSNMKATTYYKAALTDGKVKVTLLDKYFNYAECASTFWDDGTFYRNGYVLREYNTKADGTGDGYSLGSKFSTKNGSYDATLYCIWEKATEGFDYQDVTIPIPSDVKAANAPDWITSGIMITGYEGDATKVVIPERINGKTVIGIAEGAFVDRPMETLVISRHVIKIEDGAIQGCSGLREIYYPDGIYYISDNALDDESYISFKKLYVNASIAPRYSNSADGAFAVKLSKLLATEDKNRVIVISGSSSYQGIATEYMEALFGGEYKVINFGTTRTTHGTIYLEAMNALAHTGDVIVYAPENSVYMLGEPELYWKTLMDVEGMNNLFRYIDISNYTCVFNAFCDFNQTYRYQRAPRVYEQICEVATVDKNGDRVTTALAGYNDDNIYKDAYYVTFNNRIKSKNEGAWSDVALQEQNKDWTDLSNNTWCNLDDDVFVTLMNTTIAAAKTSGAKVYFGFCPTDADSIVASRKNMKALREYDALIASTYDFDGLVGSSANYVFAHQYFYDCAFHTNYYGKVLRSYRLYADLAPMLGIADVIGMTDYGTSFDNCLFESTVDGLPKYKVSFLAGG